MSGRRVIYCVEIDNENNYIFKKSLRKIQDAGYVPTTVVLDGKHGFIKMVDKVYPRLPVQMCHFHMQRIIIKYIGRNPKHEAAIEIKKLMHTLGKDDGQPFIDEFSRIKTTYQSLLSKIGDSESKKILSAINSLNSFLPYLFTYKEHKGNIPRTTNPLEGGFSHLKEKLNLHRGLNTKRKKKAFRFLALNHPKSKNSDP